MDYHIQTTLSYRSLQTKYAYVTVAFELSGILAPIQLCTLRWSNVFRVAQRGGMGEGRRIPENAVEAYWGGGTYIYTDFEFNP